MLVLRRVFEDSKGRLWFVGDEVYCYDGDSLYHFSQHEALNRVVTREILEDAEGNIWLGTSNGIVKYDPRSESTDPFTQFGQEDGLMGYDVWSMEMDSKGVLWIGTLEGVSKFDGTSFSAFFIPESAPDSTRGVTSR